MELKEGQFVDISNMTGIMRRKLFPALCKKDWNMEHRYMILFRGFNIYGYDSYSSNEDGRHRWIYSLKKHWKITEEVFIDTLGEW